MHKRLKRMCSLFNSRNKKQVCFAIISIRPLPDWINADLTWSHESLDGGLSDSDACRRAGATIKRRGWFKLT